MSPKKLKAALSRLSDLLGAQFSLIEPADEWSIAFDWLAGPIPFACYCEINSQMRAFLFRAVWQMPFPADSRPTVAEYLHRVNYSVPVGGWALEMDTGDVRWKSGLYFGDGDLTDTLMIEVIDSSFALIRLHVLGLVKLANKEPLVEALGVVGQDPGEGVLTEE